MYVFIITQVFYCLYIFYICTWLLYLLYMFNLLSLLQYYWIKKEFIVILLNFTKLSTTYLILQNYLTTSPTVAPGKEISLFQGQPYRLLMIMRVCLYWGSKCQQVPKDSVSSLDYFTLSQQSTWWLKCCSWHATHVDGVLPDQSNRQLSPAGPVNMRRIMRRCSL